MKKKLLATMLVMAMTASMVGCGQTEEPAAAPEAAPAAGAVEVEAPAAATDTSEHVTLTIAARGGSHVDVIEAVKANFEEKNNCTIEVLGLEAADLKQNVALDAANAEGAYDLCMIDDPVMPEFTEGGILLNLTAEGYQEDEDFIKASRAVGKSPYGTGDTYALPFNGNVQLFFYNKDALEKVGGTIPTSWEETLELAKKGKAAGLNGYVIRGQQGNPIVSDFLPILWAYGGNVFDDQMNVIVDSPEAKAALQMYVDLLAEGANFEKNDIVASVADGSSLMALGWPSWFISGADASAAYAAIPSKANGQEHATGMIGNWMMGVTANTTHKELAIELLKYLTSAEVQKQTVDAGCVPTRYSVSHDAEVTAKYPHLAQICDATDNSVVRPRTPKWSTIEEVWGAELSNVVSGTKTVEQGLADSKIAIEAEMAK